MPLGIITLEDVLEGVRFLSIPVAIHISTRTHRRRNL